MPELPEVETLARELRRKILGFVLSECVVRNAGILGSTGSSVKGLAGDSVSNVSRLGKYLFLEFESGKRLWLHLGMTGQIVWTPSGQTPSPHDHVLFYFKNHQEALWFRDVRKFGEVFVTSAGEKRENLVRLGPDATIISPETFAERMRCRTGKIKNLLLNQNIVAGLGNIYANESLYRAQIHPNRRPARIKAAAILKLHGAIQEVLKEAIACGGSSIDDYVHTTGAKGTFQNFHRVYGREGQACKTCGQAIRKIVCSGRSTFFCPNCQK